MKKAIIFSFALAAAFLFLHTDLQAQKMPGLDASPHDIAYFKSDNQAVVKVLYGRPQKNGREIFGKLIPYDKVWRTGANETTEVKFYRDLKVGGESVKAGTYALYTIPGASTWSIILNSGLDTWGAYQHDTSKDVLTVEVPSGSTANTVEVFTIAFKEVENGCHMVLAWDDTQVEVPIEIGAN